MVMLHKAMVMLHKAMATYTKPWSCYTTVFCRHETLNGVLNNITITKTKKTCMSQAGVKTLLFSYHKELGSVLNKVKQWRCCVAWKYWKGYMMCVGNT